MSGLNLTFLLTNLAATAASGFWIFLYFKAGSRFDCMLEPLKDAPFSEYPLKELYPIGFAFLELIHFKYRNKYTYHLFKQITYIKGVRFAKYFLQVTWASKIALPLTLFPFCAFFGVAAKSGEFFIIALVMTLVGFIYMDNRIKLAQERREEDLMLYFADALSTICLLLGAGIPFRSAWDMASRNKTGLIYQEMQITSNDIRNNMPEIDAYNAFASRCASKEIKKFISASVQNLSKGNAEMVQFLEKMTEETWEEKKHRVKQLGEQAATKLLLPIGMMFVGILIIIIVPIFTNLNF